MSLESHLRELCVKHENLEIKLDSLLSSPGAPDTEIIRLKREKLKLKDQISLVQAELSMKDDKKQLGVTLS